MNKFNRANKNGDIFRGNCALGGSKWSRTNEPMIPINRDDLEIHCFGEKPKQ